MQTKPYFHLDQSHPASIPKPQNYYPVVRQRQLEIGDVHVLLLAASHENEAAHWVDSFKSIQPSLTLKRASIRNIRDDPRLKGVKLPKSRAKSKADLAAEDLLTRKIALLY